MTLQRRDLIGFERIQAFDRRDHVVANPRPLDTFEVKEACWSLSGETCSPGRRDFFSVPFSAPLVVKLVKGGAEGQWRRRVHAHCRLSLDVDQRVMTPHRRSHRLKSDNPGEKTEEKEGHIRYFTPIIRSTIATTNETTGNLQAAVTILRDPLSYC